MDWEIFIRNITNAIVFTLIGLVFFAFALTLIVRVTKFPLRKEIEEDQNVAVAVLLGAVILGISIIVAAAIHG